MKKRIISIAITALAFVSPIVRGASLQINSTKVGDEGAISIKWESESNAVYRIEYASVLQHTNTQWQTLYDDYPSHGTNTFWMDNGDYAQEPPVKRPKDHPMRFYRIAHTGTNDAPAPYVAVTYPASNDVVSGELIVSVIATSALPVLSHTLYIDGLEVRSSEDGTNYVINTCEWGNGPHTIFATAKAASALTGFPGYYVVNYGRAVSPYVPVFFSNYVSEFNFSQPFFEPSLGQTQRVTAMFGGYSDWTLNIWNEDHVAVRTVTGSGRKLQFDWDGSGDGGASLPDGVYEYSITATETNEPAFAPGGGGGGTPPAPGFAGLMAGDGSQEWFPASPRQALAAGMTSYYAPHPPLPPLKVKGEWYAWEEIYGPVPPFEIGIPTPVQEAFLMSLVAESLSPMGGAALMATVATPKAPKKPPVKPAKNAVGTFGVAYWTYPKGLTNQVPPNGIGGNVTLDGTLNSVVWFTPVLDFTKTAQGFIKQMAEKSWKLGFHKFDQQLTRNELIRNDLIGYSGSNLFNTVNLGLMMAHGNYGTTLDFAQAAGQSRQTYLAVGNTNTPNSWVRLSDFRFGQSLRWMAILSCNSLQEDAYQSMKNKLVLPIGDENQNFSSHLHILLGCRTYAAVTANFGEVWARKMKGGAFASPQTIKDSWFNTGRQIYAGQPATNFISPPLFFKAVGWDTTLDSDKLNQYTPPDPSVDTLEDRNLQVFP